MEEAECAARSLGNRFDFFLNLAKTASGVEAYLILKGVFWEAGKVNYCSWSDVKEVLQDRLLSFHSFFLSFHHGVTFGWTVQKHAAPFSQPAQFQTR